MAPTWKCVAEHRRKLRAELYCNWLPCPRRLVDEKRREINTNGTPFYCLFVVFATDKAEFVDDNLDSIPRLLPEDVFA